MTEDGVTGKSAGLISKAYPAVSVIIPCYNSRPFIGETLESVYSQQGVNVDVIVVDDGSTDGSAEVVLSEFPNTRLVQTVNRGVSAARQLGTSMVSHEFVQYLDADDVLGPSKLSEQISALKISGADIAYGDWAKFDVYPSSGKKRIHSFNTKRIGSRPEIDLLTHFWCPPAVYLMRRSVAEAIRWHPRLPIIQDARFFLDCALHGFLFVHCPGVSAYYRMSHGSSLSTKSSVLFALDCLLNAIEIEQMWRDAGTLDSARRDALAGVYHGIASQCLTSDRGTCEIAVARVLEVKPEFVPTGSLLHKYVTKMCGYRNDLRLREYVRRTRSFIKRC